jgi:hypothetical protein
MMAAIAPATKRTAETILDRPDLCEPGGVIHSVRSYFSFFQADVV